jgi:hypothetical protein
MSQPHPRPHQLRGAKETLPDRIGNDPNRSYTTGQQMLLPEGTQKKRTQRRVTIAVNSRDRNLTTYDNSNNFRWELRRPLKDIVSVELVDGSIPADLYNVATEWNQFTFQEGAVKWDVTLTPGQYTSAQLAAELQTRLNSLPGVINSYVVVYSDITKKISINGTGVGSPAFAFLFESGTYTDTIDSRTGAVMSINCPARLLGFEWWDYSSVNNSIVAPFRADPDYCTQRVYLHINADNSIELNRVEVGAGRRDCFHIMYLDTKEGYYGLNKETFMPVYYSSPAPISRIATLNISIRDEFYRLVDLGRHDYTLLFEITYID